MRGGLATSVEEIICSLNLENIQLLKFGYDDVFVQHGSVSEIEKQYKLDSESIVNKIVDSFKFDELCIK